MNNKKQTADDVVGLINSVLESDKIGGFTTSVNWPNNTKNFSGEDYYEKDFTKSYIKFIKDIFDFKYGKITRDVIECFGDTIKTDKTQFKQSYKTTIKEVVKDKVYVHTSLNKRSMRKIVDSLSKVLDFTVDHKYSKSEKDEKEIDFTLTKILQKEKDDLPF